MKKTIVSAFLFAVACTAGLAQAQTAAPASQEFQYPSVRSRTAASPPSTLRITVTGEAGAQAPAAIGDTPASRSEYERCRRVSDRAAVSNAQMQTGVAQCLRELEQRRQQQ